MHLTIALLTILKFFIGASNDSQLIISTQDYSLLDFDVIRRDAIRFLVKDDAAEAHVDSINLSLLHKNSSLRHYVSKMNLYKQIPEMNDKLCSCNDLINLYNYLIERGLTEVLLSKIFFFFCTKVFFFIVLFFVNCRL